MGVSRLRRFAGRVRLLALGIAGLVVLSFAGWQAALATADLVVQREEIDALGERTFNEAAPEVPGITNVLLVGLDSRDTLTEEQRKEVGTGWFTSELTDTVMWVQLDAERDQVRLMSFPRDLEVHPNGGGRVKLNALHAIGGAELLVATVEDIVEADLDHYVEVDMAGFLKLTETLGGVEVCLSEPMQDDKAHIDLPAGCQELDPVEATGFVRSRQHEDEFGVGTAGRAARQQYFIRQAVSELASTGTLTSPSRVRGLIELASEAVVVDQELTTSQLLDFAHVFREVDGERVVGADTALFTSRRSEDDQLFYDTFTPEAERIFEALREGAEFPAELHSARAGGTGVVTADQAEDGQPDEEVDP